MKIFITKLFKWLGILVLVAILIVIGAVYNETRKVQEIPIFALECFWDETSRCEKNIYEWYLFKQRRDGNEKIKLYRGAHLRADDISQVKKDKIIHQYSLNSVNGKYYYFGISEQDFNLHLSSDEFLRTNGHRVNRKTLEMDFVAGNKHSKATCNEISEREFYKKIKKAREQLPDEYKFQ